MQDKGKFQVGGLGVMSNDGFDTWACWENHACLDAIRVDKAGEKMCFVFRQSDQTWHAWGLNSKLKVCSK